MIFPDPQTLILSATLGLLAGLAAWRVGALTGSGAAAAAFVGAAIYGFGGLIWAAALLLFFISSSLLSRLFERRAAEAKSTFEKGARRDWGQVAANGGLPAALAILHGLFPETGWAWPAFLGALAAVTADTWGTELGVLSRRAPRLITSGKAVPAGTSGGITAAGLLAGLGGALLIGALGFFDGHAETLPILIATAAGGLAGTLFDSWLGATHQAIYVCTRDGKETEQHPNHSCGAPTTPLRGRPWLNNDLVNLAAAAVGSLTAACIWVLFA